MNLTDKAVEVFAELPSLVVFVCVFALVIIISFGQFSAPQIPNRENIEIMCKNNITIMVECKSVVSGIFPAESHTENFCDCFIAPEGYYNGDCPCGECAGITKIWSFVDDE